MGKGASILGSKPKFYTGTLNEVLTSERKRSFITYDNDMSNYVPYEGANRDIDLGTHEIEGVFRGNADSATEFLFGFPWIDVRTYSSFSAAVTAIGATKATLIISENQIMSGDITVPVTLSILMMKGSVITTTGHTLTINGHFSCGIQQAFAGTGSVVFGNKSNNNIYPEWWKENIIPGTTDMSNAFNYAITSISIYGGNIILQPQTYLVADIELKSNVNIYGNGWSTLLKKKALASYILTCDSGSANVSNNIYNIIIKNLQLEGLSVDTGFSEHKHAININGVSHILIEHCKIIEFEGDGIYIGSSNTPATERHNENIIIRFCYFDGVNNENRNAISIIDGTNILIEFNNFVNVTKSTMPGAIDIEPDANAFARIRHITIRDNDLTAIGGNVGAISLILPIIQSSFTIPAKHITIENNRIYNVDSNAITCAQTGLVTDDSEPNIVKLINNHVNVANKAFEFLGIKNIEIFGNVFENINAASYLGYTAVDDECRDVVLRDNSFINCGIDNTLGGYGLIIYDIYNLTIDNNLFNDCGKQNGTFGYAIDFEAGSSENISIINNKFLTPNNHTTRSVVKEAGHTFTPSTNYIHGNDLHDITTLNMDNFDSILLTGATPSVKSTKKNIEYYKCDNGAATNITQFSDGKVNQIIVVRIDNNTTIKNNANILLAGGADFSGDADDIITLVCVATDEWREISRSIN